MKTLASIADIFGPKHLVYVGIELTKRHEQHLRDTVERMMDHLQETYEGKRIKGEITIVISPWQEDQEYEDILRSQKFNPQKDAEIKINMLDVAKKLDESIDMSEKEFKDLLKSMFSDVPSYHISTVVSLVKRGERTTMVERVSKRVGGLI